MAKAKHQPKFVRLPTSWRRAKPCARRRHVNRTPDTRGFKHNGQRVVVGQRRRQAAGDPFLGWTTRSAGGQRHFYIRLLSDARIKRWWE